MDEISQGVSNQAGAEPAEAPSPAENTGGQELISSLLGSTGENQPAGSPTANQGEASAPAAGEKAGTDSPAASDGALNKDGRHEENIPYERFKAVNTEAQQLKEQMAKVEQFLSNPEMVKIYLDAQLAKKEADGKAQGNSEENAINERILQLDPLEENFQANLAQLLQERDQAIEKRLLDQVGGIVSRREEESRVVQQMEGLWSKVFEGRAEDRVRLEDWVNEWAKANPGAHFPTIPGKTPEENIRFFDALVNNRPIGNQSSAVVPGANASEAMKRLLTPNTGTPPMQEAGNSLINSLKSAF
jgi:hypothetical protein